MLGSGKSDLISLNIKVGVVFLDEDITHDNSGADARRKFNLLETVKASLLSKNLNLQDVGLRGKFVACSIKSEGNVRVLGES